MLGFKLSMLIITLACLSSCEKQSADSSLSNDKVGASVDINSTSSINKTEIEKKSEIEYQYGRKLEKIDRKWFISIWHFIPPDYAFTLKRNEECEPDYEYEESFTFNENGEIKTSDNDLKRGSWTYSQNKIELLLPDYTFDDDGKILSSKNSISYYHVGKVSERIAILTKDDGSLRAMLKCNKDPNDYAH